MSEAGQIRFMLALASFCLIGLAWATHSNESHINELQERIEQLEARE